MKIQLALSTAALATMGLMSAPAQAALTPGDSGAICSKSDTLVMASDCSGSWDGNNSNQDADVYAELLGMSGIGGWLEIKDVSGQAGSLGSFSFDPAVSGPFAIALKAGNSFSLYYYDASNVGITGLLYNTIGTSVNRQGMAQDLSHATLYQPIPEPETYALMLAGLGAVGFMARRRKTA